MTSATTTTTTTSIAAPIADPAPAGPLGALPVPVLDAGSATAAVSGAAVVLLPRWTLGLAEELSRHALDHPVEFVPVRFDGALAVVGPVLRPGAAACLCCAEYQRLATAGGRVPWRSPTLELAGVPSPALSESLGALALELLEPAAPEGTGPGAESGTEPGAGSAVVYVVHLGRGTWSTHRVRPVGGCAVCHPLPADSASDVAPLPSAPGRSPIRTCSARPTR